ARVAQRERDRPGRARTTAQNRGVIELHAAPDHHGPAGNRVDRRTRRADRLALVLAVGGRAVVVGITRVGRGPLIRAGRRRQVATGVVAGGRGVAAVAVHRDHVGVDGGAGRVLQREGDRPGRTETTRQDRRVVQLHA